MIKIQYTPGQPGARVFSRISTHEFDTREQAEYFAAIFDKSPAHMGDNLRFGWALGYLAKEMDAAPTAGDVFPSLAPTIVTCEANRRIMEGEAVTADDVEPPSSGHRVGRCNVAEANLFGDRLKAARTIARNAGALA